jgi:hypothetical protein
MHVYLRLLQLFPFVVLPGVGEELPPAGFSFVITKRGNHVVTGSGARLIATEY